MVGSPCVQSTSLTATGRPASRPRGLPALRRRSISSAWASAAAGSTRKKARTAPSCRSMRSKHRRVSSTEVTSPAASCRTSSVAVRSVMYLVVKLRSG